MTNGEKTMAGDVPVDVRLRIANKLTDIESRFGVRILYACESGSRGERELSRVLAGRYGAPEEVSLCPASLARRPMGNDEMRDGTHGIF